jgi:hypothetical protein
VTRARAISLTPLRALYFFVRIRLLTPRSSSLASLCLLSRRTCEKFVTKRCETVPIVPMTTTRLDGLVTESGAFGARQLAAEATDFEQG